MVERAADHARSGGVRRRRMLVAVFVDRAVRVALVVFWWWLGWHFLVAQTVDP
jgi:uncharacterized protein DUF6186